ncbi:biotin-independent malonate decarboxylase subunit gamma [Xanthomonas nasturtii]|uniref:Biotin-independent malonate decarboxylase subunit gamma n=1 Tax=Xanthomonas nasturtii TaxID=1843581 RepID=A0A3E1KJN5_9XANT|nr:biotin-independent malonate decarboxylase subunit gamma [Xanthomonas nasturtii]MCL1499746.1 biotin-independent malonate decarboxylase subunit gamma [Xanthomonas nasturtii]MCL1503420.1 biotin-independent malonate decarboxylase subunit gamma [Xanthomonas nasturtii]MCL1521491.1 biotin-independent malonate decarboxylase subunit gamma [Xanthomonas nasturtii]MCL1527407.1 biotin-independent malonate decarboxylase subunit gamma [Xanthomonas nasturtii]MCL1531308.1 biotin-independent malonate decarbo
MQLSRLLDQLFPLGHTITRNDDVLTGSATTAAGEVTVIGTADKLEVGVDHALALAATVLASTRAHPQRPIVMLADTAGQRLARRDELLGINGYFAHLARTLDLARKRGAQLVTLVYGESVSGGFLSFGLMADHIHALPDAQIRVMDLRAMARVTKQSVDTLQALSKSSPVFAPGVENYVRMGAVESLWDGDLAQALLDALAAPTDGDQRRALGAQRGGRTLARDVAASVAAGEA